MSTLFLKPGLSKSGASLSVYIPALKRACKPEGETLEVDSFIARRIAEGSLVITEDSHNGL